MSGMKGTSSRAGRTWPNPTAPKRANRSTRPANATSKATRPPHRLRHQRGTIQLQGVEQHHQPPRLRGNGVAPLLVRRVAQPMAGHVARVHMIPRAREGLDIVAPEIGGNRPTVNEDHGSARRWPRLQHPQIGAIGQRHSAARNGWVSRRPPLLRRKAFVGHGGVERRPQARRIAAAPAPIR